VPVINSRTPEYEEGVVATIPHNSVCLNDANFHSVTRYNRFRSPNGSSVAWQMLHHKTISLPVHGGK
jgi:hypothetical protein